MADMMGNVKAFLWVAVSIDKSDIGADFYKPVPKELIGLPLETPMADKAFMSWELPHAFLHEYRVIVSPSGASTVMLILKHGNRKELNAFLVPSEEKLDSVKEIFREAGWKKGIPKDA